ncbi:MAG: hypothetical protein ABEI74_04280 [Candidatus Pacearchaeota archaeon]
MVNATEVITNNFGNFYSNVVGGLSQQGQTFVTLLLLTVLVSVYAVLVWKFYVLISTKNILRLNLNKYNTSSHPILEKTIAGALYVVEYLVILPVLIYVSFIFLTILLSIISRHIEPQLIVLISAITIASVRATAYIPRYGESVSKEIAKVVPLTMLVVGFTQPDFFKPEGITQSLIKIPEAISIAGTYIVFIVILELALRLLSFISDMLGITPQEEVEKEEEEGFDAA